MKIRSKPIAVQWIASAEVDLSFEVAHLKTGHHVAE
jgi:hypothetical protein